MQQGGNNGNIPHTAHTSNRSTDPHSHGNHTPSYGTHPTHNNGRLGGRSALHTSHTHVHNTDNHKYRDRTATDNTRTTHTHTTHNGSRPDDYTHFYLNIFGVRFFFIQVQEGI